MIVGTAGHIDHGKTTLVKALTGVDTDRLPEEKQRGISIELGYAFLDAGDGARIGFIDVPGHERLVHTMLAGATGIDHALLLVAADDGVMPQTREHLAVLALLGLADATLVITKADRADATRRAAVAAELRALVQATPLADAPLVAVSATTGEGVADLQARLIALARQRPPHAAAQAAFRLAVDRAFTLDGVGTVATGTVHAGRVRVGDELRLVPGERVARVRSLHAQNRPVQEAGAGQRCAIALAGVARDEIERGQWLVDPAVALSTSRIDARLSLWHEESKPLRSGTPVHVHIGPVDMPGTVAVLDEVPDADGGAGADALAPGHSRLVQLVLRAPIGAWHGERVVLRDASASRTLAGGRVLDPLAPTRYRRTPARLAELAALEQGDAQQCAAAVLQAAPLGLDWRRLGAALGQPLPAPLLPQQPSDATPLHAGDWALAAGHAATASQALITALAAFHDKHPEELGPDAARLRRLALPRLPQALCQALLARLQAQGAVALRGSFVHLPAHGVRLSATEERIAQKAAPWLTQAGFEGAWARDLARHCAESEALVRTTLARLAQRGELHQVVKDLYYPPHTMATLATLAREVAGAHGGEVTAAGFRDATQLGRKRAIQILEHFDRIGLTRRVADTHRLRTESQLFTADAAVAARSKDNAQAEAEGQHKVAGQGEGKGEGEGR